MKVGLSMQIGDLTKPSNPTKTESSWPNLTPSTVGDGSQPSKTDSGWLSGEFHPQKPEPPNSPNKHSKKAKNYLDPKMIWRSLASIWPRLASLYSNLAKIYYLPHLDLLKSGDIWLDLAQTYSNLATFSPHRICLNQLMAFLSPIRLDLCWSVVGCGSFLLPPDLSGLSPN